MTPTLRERLADVILATVPEPYAAKCLEALREFFLSAEKDQAAAAADAKLDAAVAAAVTEIAPTIAAPQPETSSVPEPVATASPASTPAPAVATPAATPDAPTPAAAETKPDKPVSGGRRTVPTL